MYQYYTDYINHPIYMITYLKIFALTFSNVFRSFIRLAISIGTNNIGLVW